LVADDVRYARERKPADADDQQIRNEESRVSGDPAFAADTNNNQDDTIAVRNVDKEMPEKETDRSEEANKSSSHQSSCQGKSKKKKKKEVSKGTESAGTMNKDEVEMKECKEDTCFLEGMLSVL